MRTVTDWRGDAWRARVVSGKRMWPSKRIIWRAEYELDEEYEYGCGGPTAGAGNWRKTEGEARSDAEKFLDRQASELGPTPVNRGYYI